MAVTSHARIRPARPVPTRRRRPVLILVGALVVLAALVGGYAVIVERTFSGHVHREALSAADDRAPAGAGRTILLLGSNADTADPNGTGRTDTILVLHVSADGRSAYLITVSRDLYVAIPDNGRNKIAAAYSFGGAPLVARTVEDLLDVRLDQLIGLDLDDLAGLVDDLGGVRLDNPAAFDSAGQSFAAGPIELTGERARVFLQERLDRPDAAQDQAQREQLLIRAVLAHGLSDRVIADPPRFLRFVRGAAERLRIDDGLNNGELWRMARAAGSSGIPVVAVPVPVSGFGEANGVSIDVVDTARLAELSTALHEDTMAAYVAAHPPR